MSSKYTAADILPCNNKAREQAPPLPTSDRLDASSAPYNKNFHNPWTKLNIFQNILSAKLACDMSSEEPHT
jgi:hypothetical protein